MTRQTTRSAPSSVEVVTTLFVVLAICAAASAETSLTVVWSTTGHAASVQSVAFSPDGQRVASGGTSPDSAVVIWDAADGAPLATLPGHHAGVISVEFCGDGAQLAAGHVQIGDVYPVQSGVTYIWDLDSETVVDSFLGGFVSVDAAGGDVLSAGWGIVRDVGVHRVPGGQELADIYTGDYITAAALSADGAIAASGKYEGDVDLWSVSSESLMRTLAHGGPVRAIAFSPDDQYVATAGQGEGAVVYLWQPGTGALVRTLDAGDAYISDVAFSPDGQTMMAAVSTASFERRIRFWNVADGALLETLNPGDDVVNSVAWSPSAATIAYGLSNGEVVVARNPLMLAGDVNCDGLVDFGDINPFVAAITDEALYRATYPNCDPMYADVTGDGAADFGDINPFVALLLN